MMRRRRVFGRRVRSSSPVAPTELSPSKQTYPPPPFISPKKGRMEPRDGVPAPSKWSYSEPEGGSLELMSNESPNVVGESEAGTYDCTPPGSPRRDSEVLFWQRWNEETMDEAQQRRTPLPTRNEDKLRDNTSRSLTPRPVSPLFLAISPPDKTWHFYVAAWQIMGLAQRHEFDLAYVVHMHRDIDQNSRWQARCDDSLRSERVTGQLLAAYGIHRLSPTSRMPSHSTLLQKRYSEYRAETADPNQISYGQIYTFYRSFCDDAVSIPPSHIAHYAQRTIDQGVILALYRRAKHGPTLYDEVAERFVEGIVDLYVANGFKTLLLDSPSRGADLLHQTSLIGS